MIDHPKIGERYLVRGGATYHEPPSESIRTGVIAPPGGVLLDSAVPDGMIVTVGQSGLDADGDVVVLLANKWRHYVSPEFLFPLDERPDPDAHPR